MGPKTRKIPPDFCRKPAIWQDAMAEVKRTFQKVADVKQSGFSRRNHEHRWGPILSRNRRAKIHSQVPSKFGSARLPQEVLDEILTNRSQSCHVSVTHVHNVLGMWKRIESQSTRKERMKNPQDWRLFPVFIRRPPAGSEKLLSSSSSKMQIPLAYSPPKFTKLHGLSSPPGHRSKRPTTSTRAASCRPLSANEIAKRSAGGGGHPKISREGFSRRPISRHSRRNHMTPESKPWASHYSSSGPHTFGVVKSLESSERVRSKSKRISLREWIANLYPYDGNNGKVMQIPKYCIERPPSRCKRRPSSSTSESTGGKIGTVEGTVQSENSFVAAADLSLEADRTGSSNAALNSQCGSELDSHIHGIQSESNAKNEQPDGSANIKEDRSPASNSSNRGTTVGHAFAAATDMPFPAPGLPALSRNKFERPPSRRGKELSGFSSIPNSSISAQNYARLPSSAPPATSTRPSSSDHEAVGGNLNVSVNDSDDSCKHDDEAATSASNSSLNCRILCSLDPKNGVEFRQPSPFSSSNGPNSVRWNEQNSTCSKESSMPFVGAYLNPPKCLSEDQGANSNADYLPRRNSDGSSRISSLLPGSSSSRSSVESGSGVEMKDASDIYSDFRNSILHTITTEGLEKEEEIEEVCRYFLDLSPPSYRKILIRVIADIKEMLKEAKSSLDLN